MKSERKRLGKAWKEGKTGRNDFEKYYLEFKEEIDSELNQKPKKEIKPKEKK